MTRLLIKEKRLSSVLWCLLLAGYAAVASETLQAEIRFAPAKEGPVWVGEKLELNLELWSTGFSFGDQLFVLPEVSGGYLLQADTTTVKLSESRGGVQWQGLSYTFLFYPQRAGRLEVPSFEVKFSSGTGYGSEPTYFDYRTPTLYIEARLPPGVDPGTLLVTTDSFGMESSWSPRVPGDGPVELKVGDALTLTVDREAQGVPGMVFTPLPEYTIEGVSDYPDPPVVNDQVNRGSLTGSRIDSVTYIFERQGDYTIPELRFQWWDPAKEVLSEKNVPETTVTVMANPAFANQPDAVGRSVGRLNWKALAWVLGGLVVLAILLRLALLHFRADNRAKALAWLYAVYRSTIRWVIRDANELPPLNPASTKAG